MLSSKYDSLQDIDLSVIEDNDINLIINLGESIRQNYTERLKNDVENNVKKPTETLISKILLGTLCCAPAYDRYFREKLKLKGIKNSGFPKKPFYLKRITTLNIF